MNKKQIGEAIAKARMETIMDNGKRLSKYRISADLSTKGKHFSPQKIGNVEAGREYTISTLLAICKYLNLEVVIRPKG